MPQKILIRRGLKKNLPELSIGEPALTTDTKEFFVGADGGNVALANKDVLDKQVEKIKQHWLDIVSDFNVDNTGKTDVTTVFNSAIDYCKTKGVNLIIPDGSYLINKDIFDFDHVIIKDNGTYPNRPVHIKRDFSQYTTNDIVLTKLFDFNITTPGYTVLQGGVVIGDALFFMIRQPSGAENPRPCRIIKVNKITGQVISENIINAYHGNSMTYNPKTGKIYICYNDSAVIKKGCVVNPTTLAVEGEYTLNDHSHYTFSYDPDYKVYVSGGGGKAMVWDENFNPLTTFDLTTSYGTRQSTAAFDGYVWHLVSNINGMRVFDYFGNALHDYRFIYNTKLTELEFITHDGGGRCIFGFYESGKASFYTGELIDNPKIMNIGESFYDDEKNTPIWWTGKEYKSLYPVLDFIASKGMYGAIRDFGVTEIFETNGDVNKINYTGFYYVVDGVANLPVAANGYLIVVGSYNGHCIQFYSNTYTANHTLYMRKGTASGGVVTTWSDWKSLDFG